LSFSGFDPYLPPPCADQSGFAPDNFTTRQTARSQSLSHTKADWRLTTENARIKRKAPLPFAFAKSRDQPGFLEMLKNRARDLHGTIFTGIAKSWIN
jgi:hypothetical protein